jgi:23S rRNA pseudouridine1911/1915/1917 synthase
MLNSVCSSWRPQLRAHGEPMIQNATFEAQAEESGKRLDVVLLARFPSATRAFCRRAVEAGQTLVNGRPGLKGYKLRAGDTVSVAALKEASDNRVWPDASVPVRILFEDAHLVAANKPAGLAVHPLTSEEHGTLMNGLVARYPELAEVGDQPLRPDVPVSMRCSAPAMSGWSPTSASSG